MHEQEAAGEVGLYYFDESGFSLTPDVPYDWQAMGETIEIPSSRSKRLNVLGFCNKQQDFHATTVQGYVDSEIVIACFDQFCDTINKKTIVVVDNASMHTSSKFKGKLREWEENGLIVKYLPTYSPELNLIEIVWRFIKYHWLPLSAYVSFKNKAEVIVSHLSGDRNLWADALSRKEKFHQWLPKFSPARRKLPDVGALCGEVWGWCS